MHTPRICMQVFADPSPSLQIDCLPDGKWGGEVQEDSVFYCLVSCQRVHLDVSTPSLLTCVSNPSFLSSQVLPLLSSSPQWT